MRLTNLSAIGEHMEFLVSTGALPGAAFGVATATETIAVGARGFRQLNPDPLPMTADTVFDLASLTKVVATTAITMRFLERGLLRLDDLVSRFEPGNFGEVRLRHLLTHTSGFPSWLDLTAHPDPYERVVAIAQSSRLYEPGQRVLYSDLNYILLGHILEQLAALPLDRLFIKEVANPLGLAHMGYLPTDQSNMAATELDVTTNRHWCGVVHDENARASGGVSGHAGLFGTVADLLRFGQAILDPQGWLSGPTIATWLLPRTEGIPGELRAYGFQKPHPLSSAGDLMSPEAVGHTGFTGTSLWVDPQYGVVMVLLTNRVHLGREANAPIRLRPIFHNMVLAGLRP